MSESPLDAPPLQHLLQSYQQLLEEIDRWFAGCIDQFPEQIECNKGCSACCRALFEINLLDAALLQQGLQQLDATIRQQVLARAQNRKTLLQQQWPELKHPYFLNHLPHNDWEEMPEDDPTPCPLLGDDGDCLSYRQRPLLCRLHGLPNIDLSGEIFQADYCTLNFPDRDALKRAELRHPFRRLYRREFELLGEFSELVLDHRDLEIDTFIPLALLIDFCNITGKRG